MCVCVGGGGVRGGGGGLVVTPPTITQRIYIKDQASYCCYGK